jgi:hypothetical protein
MTKPKPKNNYRVSDIHLRMFLKDHLESYFRDHPLVFLEARKMMGSHSLAKRVAFKVFPE